jgi:uncharacterized protein
MNLENQNTPVFDLEKSIEHIKHYLPSQWALKDFIHHNTLHAFQHKSFFEGLNDAYEVFGYKVTLNISEYNAEYTKGRITDDVVDRVLASNFVTEAERKIWKKDMFEFYPEHDFDARIGNLRENWRTKIGLDMDAMVYPTLFRILSNYLDQGISIWKFPIADQSFIGAIREMEKNGLVSIFRRKRAKVLLSMDSITTEDLLKILVGSNQSLYETYLYDQQFEHNGWSGFVSEVEKNAWMLLDNRQIKTSELIYLECLMEIDALDYKFGEGKWYPLEDYLDYKPLPLFDKIIETKVFTIAKLWQEAFEWSYYFPVLKGMIDNHKPKESKQVDFQTIMCIDDRICSWRRYIEELAPNGETFSTPGFFGLDMVFQPEGGKFYTKVCPMPMTPQYLVKEVPVGYNFGSLRKKVTAKLTKNKIHHHDTDIHFSQHAHNSIFGWISSQFIGFFSALNLVSAVLFPRRSAATASPFNHMEKDYPLSIENHNHEMENGFHLGYTTDEMATRVFNMLTSIGLNKNFAPIIYVIGHGSTSTNNPYYAGYDCGACSGRAGSVNARVFSQMVNKTEVRNLLKEKGIDIPNSTVFMGGLHDTTQDVVQFFDKDEAFSSEQRIVHLAHKQIMRKALVLNAKERSRRFDNVDGTSSMKKIHDSMKRRAISFFEPRPEYNHATNALCIVGRRDMTKGLFLDRRAFLNSYDYRVDTEGKFLQGILNAAAPVCGGINLEYYFSRTDNSKLGSGSKLPHNVIGLFGVANGIEGDLRPGLPAQMIEIHDPVRLMIIVEQLPDIIVSAIQANAATYEWFINEWIHLICYHPTENKMMEFKGGKFEDLELFAKNTPVESSQELMSKFESIKENMPVVLIENNTI